MFLRVSWDTEEEDERKGRGCMLQYQHSLIRVLTVFTAESPDPSSPSPAYFLGSDWQVDVTRLVRYFLRVGDTSIARLQAGSVLTGKAVGVTTVQVMVIMTESPAAACFAQFSLFIKTTKFSVGLFNMSDNTDSTKMDCLFFCLLIFYWKTNKLKNDAMLVSVVFWFLLIR